MRWFNAMALATADQDDSALAVRRRLLSLMEAGAFGADGRLPAERELSERFSVSRRTLRRALDSLEAEALIWRHQGKGTFIGLAPDPTGALAAEIAGETHPLEVMEARLCIEPQLAALCAVRALPSDVERMRALAARVVTAPDPDATELWDGALHRLIARTAQNRPLLTAFSLLDEIRSQAGWRKVRSRARSPETMQVTDRQHHAIINAIEAGEPESAQTLMRDHLLALAANLERTLVGSAALEPGDGSVQAGPDKDDPR